MITIRNEEERDYKVVEEITRKAFYNLYIPGCAEHYLVHIVPEFVWEEFYIDQEINDRGILVDTSFAKKAVELDGQVIGNIMYTKARLVDEAGTEKEILTFGPVSIAPEYQRRGYGRMLIEHSFEQAVLLGYDVVVILGSPMNYVGCGFKSSRKLNICMENGKYPAAMMVKELVPNQLDGRKWFYYDSPVMAISEEEAQEYDNTLEKMEKKYQPSQEEFYIMSHAFIE